MSWKEKERQERDRQVLVHHGAVHGQAQAAHEGVAAGAADVLRRVLDAHVAQVRRPLPETTRHQYVIHIFVGTNFSP